MRNAGKGGGADERAISGHSSSMNRTDVGRGGIRQPQEQEGKAPKVPFTPKQLPSAASNRPPGAHPTVKGGSALKSSEGPRRSAPSPGFSRGMGGARRGGGKTGGSRDDL